MGGELLFFFPPSFSSFLPSLDRSFVSLTSFSQEFKDKKGEMYYYNHLTQKTQKEKPLMVSCLFPSSSLLFFCLFFCKIIC